ncbi:MAG: hypothetical protein J1F35_02180 [Erysipelotrichales bacterium]|nr:hypothetical protein [Erysipelotrichales bacterium]
MKKFNELKYERINFDETIEKIESLTNELEMTKDYESFIQLTREIISIQNHIEEMFDYADIRNMRDSKDEFYESEISYWTEFKPKFDILFLPFYKIIINSSFKERLLEIIPSNFFSTIEYQLKTTSEEVVLLQKHESELKNEYKALNASKIMFDGKEENRAFVASFFSDKDRATRKKAHDAINDYYYSKQKEYDKLLFDLVKTRNEIAGCLGFDNYVAYSLYKLRRFGYNYDDIKVFRDNIKKYFVPLNKKLSEWQKEELGLEKLEYYDTVFFSEMPKSKYIGADMLRKLSSALKSIDSNLATFFDEMLENGYIDLLQRDNKVNFSITNYLSESGIPTITGNFKNNYNDIFVTTHELGHSYQKHCASIKDRDYIVSSLLKYPTLEIAEMFSHAMELISLAYLPHFFSDDDYKKFCFMKIYTFVSMLPYICLVDEFQESIYSNINLTVEDIRKTWLDLAKKYGLKYHESGHINIKSGGYFYRQSHLYLDPFYYIDYALSYFGAFILWDNCKESLDLFREIGGIASYYSFDELIHKYGLPNPFKEETVHHIAKTLENELISKRP